MGGGKSWLHSLEQVWEIPRHSCDVQSTLLQVVFDSF